MSRAQKIELDKDELIIPIYVDTNTLLDLLASIEGGFSVVEKMTSHYGGPFCQDKKSACVKIQNPPLLLMKNVEGQVRFMPL